jgi:Transposase DNA-binding/Transposase DDE domain
MNVADYTNMFNDARLSARGKSLLRDLFKVPSNSIQSLSLTRADQKGYYRFLNNSKVTEDILSHEMGIRCGKAVKDKVVLCIQDTTEINLFRHTNRLKPNTGIGPIDAVKKGIGFKIHPCLVVDAYNYFPYGYAGIQVYHREGIQQMPYHELRKVPIAQKESSKWIKGNERVEQYLGEAKSVIIIQDREGDIFEQFTADALCANAQLIIRNKYNRYLSDEDRLWDKLAQSPAQGTYELYIPADTHKKTPARKALMEVRYVEVQLKCPEKKPKPVAALSKPVYVIETKEITPGITDPIHWRLTTTCSIACLADAQQVIEWYSCRWMIEEVFRVLKKECYDIEGSELEQGWAIRKLSLLILDTTIRLFQMLIAYNTPEGELPVNSDIVFAEAELECLEQVNKKIQGTTPKLANPYALSHLKGATWTIARLGGWKGYQSQRPPGATTLLKGLKIFYNYFQGFCLQKDVGTR